MKIFIQEHLKAIIISLAAVICVTGTVIGILLYNSEKADEPEAQEEASVATATDTKETLVGEVLEDENEKVSAKVDEKKEQDKKKESDKMDQDKDDSQNTKKESSKDKDSSKESKNNTKTNDSDKSSNSKTTEATAEKAGNSGGSSSNSGSKSSDNGSSSNSGSKSSESGSGSKSSDSGSGNSGSNSSSSESTACSHNWVWATKTVHHDAVTKQEPYYGEEWDEPVYRDVIQCIGCGRQYNSVDEYINNDEHSNWTTVQVVDHYEHHDPDILGYDTVVVKEAYDETVNDYQYCSKCGARK